ncbi:MAG: BspA family leucine-rich repeat surface protein, partial [Bacilli bacterium]|nr:BspA family leucine-rich repeat surface protein [Bacilli bacterium]
FYYCSSLTQIKISSLWDVTNVTSSNNMFYNCSNLPNYNLSNIDVSMAKPTTQGGYMTLV